MSQQHNSLVKEQAEQDRQLIDSLQHELNILTQREEQNNEERKTLLN